MSAEDFNAGYGIYVLPVNNDGKETDFSSSNTIIKYIHMQSNYNKLGSFSLTDFYGPIEIPNNNNEIALYLEFYYYILNPSMSDWTVEISLDGSSWSSIVSSGLSVFGSYLPTGNAGYIKHFSLNNYKGRSLYFRTRPDSFGSDSSMQIKNEIREYKY